MDEKNLYIIAGCNGAGKTTASFTILPEILDCKEFVNADEIAKGLSPFQPEKVSFEAGRIMLHRITELVSQNETFAFETTLSTKSFKNRILEAKHKNYNVTLLFFWLKNPELAKERRYYKGIKNLFKIYLSIVDQALIFDNSEGNHNLIAEMSISEELIILNQNKFNELKNYL